VERTLRDAADCTEQLTSIYGTDPAADRGVLHVVACWSDPADPQRALRVIRGGTGSPASATDRFVLSAARARACAIVTTGQILRDEPKLEHRALLRDAGSRAAIADWRRRAVGLRADARSVVLSSGRALDLAHPIFRNGTALLFTQLDAAAELRERAKRRGVSVEVIGRSAAGLGDTLAALRDDRGCQTVLVEAGPSSARDLYTKDAPPLVDELLLSIFEEDTLAADFVGPPLASLVDLEAHFGLRGARFESHEESGRWSFRRLRRSARLARTEQR
jgi:riboflavin biosynthesis pyrimidine reductase